MYLNRNFDELALWAHNIIKFIRKKCFLFNLERLSFVRQVRIGEKYFLLEKKKFLLEKSFFYLKRDRLGETSDKPFHMNLQEGNTHLIKGKNTHFNGLYHCFYGVVDLIIKNQQMRLRSISERASDSKQLNCTKVATNSLESN